MDALTYTEEITTMVKVGEKDKKSKKSTPNFFVHLLDCLNKGKHGHMLKYVPNSNNKEFQVIFINKHYSGWTEQDISLFEDSDKYIEQIHGRSLESLDSKGRFRARLRKCLGKYVRSINKEKDEGLKYKTVGQYRILQIPENSYVDATSRNKGRIKRKSCGKEKEKKKKKEVKEKSSHEIAHLANMPLEGNYNMHSENVCHENNTKIIPCDALKEKDKDSHFLCYLTISRNNTTGSNPSMKFNILKMWEVPNTFWGNLNASTNLVALGGRAPSMGLNVPNMGMEIETVIGNLVANMNVANVGVKTVIGNSDANTNLVTLGGYLPSMNLNVPNVGMETETVIGNSDASVNVPNVAMETVIGNSDANTNLVTLGSYAPSMNLNVPNVRMETETVIGNSDASVNVPNVAMKTVIGNSDANTNLVTLSGYAPSMNLNLQNVRMETETVIGNSDASINVPNVGMKTVIGNSDANTNLVTLGSYAPSINLNVPNVRMETETVIGNSDACVNISNVAMKTVVGNSDANTNLVILGDYAPSMDLNVPNVGMETVIGNSDANTNLVTLGGYTPSMDLNAPNVGMETETVIENSDASINVPNVGMKTVTGNLDANTNLSVFSPLDGFFPNLDLNAPNLEMEPETVIEKLDACINLQNMGMETVTGNLDTYVNDSIIQECIDDWLSNFQPIEGSKHLEYHAI